MIICEIGLNHLGIEDYANQYIDAVVNTKADAITFQVIKDSFFKKEEYKKLKLRKEFFIEALLRTKRKRKQFGAAIDDETEVRSLEQNGIDFFKVLSKDLNNYRLIDEIIKASNKPIFISTGMSNLREIERLFNRYETEKNRITLIQTQLSNKIEDVNFAAIPLLRDTFQTPVAYGFHSSNHNALYMSVAYNPESIFFYIKQSDDVKYPDDAHAITLENISTVVDNLLELQLAIGSGQKIKMENWS